jgi:hypothetical protein
MTSVSWETAPLAFGFDRYVCELTCRPCDGHSEPAFLSRPPSAPGIFGAEQLQVAPTPQKSASHPETRRVPREGGKGASDEPLPTDDGPLARRGQPPHRRGRTVCRQLRAPICRSPPTPSSPVPSPRVSLVRTNCACCPRSRSPARTSTQRFPARFRSDPTRLPPSSPTSWVTCHGLASSASSW